MHQFPVFNSEDLPISRAGQTPLGGDLYQAAVDALIAAQGLALGFLAVVEIDGDVAIGRSGNVPRRQDVAILRDDDAAAERRPDAYRDNARRYPGHDFLGLFLNGPQIVDRLGGLFLEDIG